MWNNILVQEAFGSVPCPKGMELFLAGSLSGGGSLPHLPLSLQPYAFSPGIKITTTRSEMKSNEMYI